MAIADHPPVSSTKPIRDVSASADGACCFETDLAADSCSKPRNSSPRANERLSDEAHLRDANVNWFSDIANDVIKSENTPYQKPSSVCSNKPTSGTTSPPRPGCSRDQRSRRGELDSDEPSRRIDYLDSDVAQEVLDMGFDRESVRNVIYLQLVKTGKPYRSASELVDSVLAYDVSLTDVEVRSRDFEEAISSSLGSRGDELQPQLPGDSNEATRERSELADFDEVDSSLATRAATNESSTKSKRSKKSKRKKRVTGDGGATDIADSAVEPVVLHATNTNGFITDDVAPSWLLEQENRRLKLAKKCKICREADINIVFIPCGHFICCDGCSSFLLKCTVCQKKIRSSNKVFIP